MGGETVSAVGRWLRRHRWPAAGSTVVFMAVCWVAVSAVNLRWADEPVPQKVEGDRADCFDVHNHQARHDTPEQVREEPAPVAPPGFSIVTIAPHDPSMYWSFEETRGPSFAPRSGLPGWPESAQTATGTFKGR